MNGLPWGGSEELWYRSALYAAQKGWKVGCAVYHWKEKEEKIQRLAQAGCSIYWLPNDGRSKSNLKEKIQYQLTKFRLRQFIQTLPVREYDTVVINQGGFEIFTPAWRNYWKQLDHYTLLFHNYDKNEQWGADKQAAVKNWVSKAHLNLFASGEIRASLQKQLGMSISNSAMLINPITITPPDYYIPYPSIESGEYIFAMFAALETNRKAQDHLVQALAAPQWKNRNWKLLLYGEGKDRKTLETLISQFNLAGKVILKGHTDSIANEMAKAHLILQITHKDAMPISVVEAMALSRPVIVSDVGDMPVWVREGVNGFVSPDASVDSINETLERAWQQKNSWPVMGAKSFEIFKEKYPAAVESFFLTQLGL